MDTTMFSEKLASVLEDIGVNEHTVKMKRRTMLLCENLETIVSRLQGENKTHHNFGSQSEGSSTIGLKSDYDTLVSHNDYIVLQDDRELQPGFHNFLMFQDVHTQPGYCMLWDILCEFRTFTEFHDRIYALKNTCFDKDGHIKHGPAFLITINADCVNAFPYKTLPNFVKTWLKQQLKKGRLTKDMKREIESKPCYAVPVGRKGSPNEHLEWRISTSHAERCLMFNLNITQIQCYVMFKLMLQTHLKHPTEQGLSSFMCKNVLLLCIEDTPDLWCPQNLLTLFQKCLLKLEQCVSEECCPHFIMHDNNLMAGKFTTEVKHWLLEKIQTLYQDTVSPFRNLTTDHIDKRLDFKINNIEQIMELKNLDISKLIFGKKLYNLAQSVHDQHKQLLHAVVAGKTTHKSCITKIKDIFHREDNLHLQQEAISLLEPLIFSCLGSELASRDIQHGHPVSAKAMVWIFLGLDSDVASGRLKLASVYYCTSDYSRAEAILRIINNKYDTSLVEAVCNCIDHDSNDWSEGFAKNAYGGDEHAIRDIVAYGIRFIRSEINCAPKELQYEMFRSTQKDLEVYRHKEGYDNWMDWAVVDALPYLYFLQYKTYGHLQRPAEQLQALENLKSSISKTKNLEHKETALNLLGQCMEQEKMFEQALTFYSQSLKTRPRNNAASLHICRLLNSLISAM